MDTVAEKTEDAAEVVVEKTEDAAEAACEHVKDLFRGSEGKSRGRSRKNLKNLQKNRGRI